GRVAGATDHRGLSLGISSRLLGAGQRPCLRTCLQVAGEGDGYSRSTDLASIALAKSVCGASDWRRTSRVPRLGADLPRIAPPPNTFLLSFLLEGDRHALGALQGCAARSGSATARGRYSHPHLVRAAPPLRSDMIFGRYKFVSSGCIRLTNDDIVDLYSRVNIGTR